MDFPPILRFTWASHPHEDTGEYLKFKELRFSRGSKNIELVVIPAPAGLGLCGRSCFARVDAAGNYRHATLGISLSPGISLTVTPTHRKLTCRYIAQYRYVISYTFITRHNHYGVGPIQAAERV